MQGWVVRYYATVQGSCTLCCHTDFTKHPETRQTWDLIGKRKHTTQPMMLSRTEKADKAANANDILPFMHMPRLVLLTAGAVTQAVAGIQGTLSLGLKL